jgi:hypothetical protein
MPLRGRGAFAWSGCRFFVTGGGQVCHSEFKIPHYSSGNQQLLLMDHAGAAFLESQN